ncbi:MAG: FAD-dependent monooxygenase [Cohaesibacter sp.]|nr:FAD-dependent monooxygenase [Cohaesibacter sp.]
MTIIGAGVAGLAAAIAACRAGFDVRVFERSSGLTHQPGETLHPGIEPLLEMLGVWQEVAQSASYRHLGIRTRNETGYVDRQYGDTDGTPWRGLQIQRLALKQILLEEAQKLGAHFCFAAGPIHILQAEGDDLILSVGHAHHCTHWVLDASGQSNWLRKHDRSTYESATKKLSVCYGYSAVNDSEVEKDWPEIHPSSTGWIWKAFISKDQIAWARLTIGKPEIDPLFKHRTGVADATWKLSKRPVSKNLFRIGDAAFRMDPSTGKGVLRAIMSAMMAVHLARHHHMSDLAYCEIERTYTKWLSGWFWSDFKEISPTAPWMRL